MPANLAAGELSSTIDMLDGSISSEQAQACMYWLRLSAVLAANTGNIGDTLAWQHHASVLR